MWQQCSVVGQICSGARDSSNGSERIVEWSDGGSGGNVVGWSGSGIGSSSGGGGGTGCGSCGSGVGKSGGSSGGGIVGQSGSGIGGKMPMLAPNTTIRGSKKGILKN